MHDFPCTPRRAVHATRATCAQVLIYGDCAVNVHPSSAELAQIAVTSADTAAAFGVEPRVALLSYSTFGSGSGPEVDRVRAPAPMPPADSPPSPRVTDLLHPNRAPLSDTLWLALPASINEARCISLRAGLPAHPMPLLPGRLLWRPG